MIVRSGLVSFHLTNSISRYCPLIGEQIGLVTGIGLAVILFLGFGAFSHLFSTDSEVLEIAWSGILVSHFFFNSFLKLENFLSIRTNLTAINGLGWLVDCSLELLWNSIMLNLIGFDWLEWFFVQIWALILKLKIDFACSLSTRWSVKHTLHTTFKREVIGSFVVWIYFISVSHLDKIYTISDYGQNLMDLGTSFYKQNELVWSSWCFVMDYSTTMGYWLQLVILDIKLLYLYLRSTVFCSLLLELSQWMLLPLSWMGSTMGFPTMNMLLTLWCLLFYQNDIINIILNFLFSPAKLGWVGTGRSDLIRFPSRGCSCIWSSWSLDWVICIHDLACSIWNLEVN